MENAGPEKGKTAGLEPDFREEDEPVEDTGIRWTGCNAIQRIEKCTVCGNSDERFGNVS
jgi:hypothetical protein